jgi:pantoate--beta-alanine ligase
VKTLRSIADVRVARAGYGRLGLVPTMGFLHQGHLSLVRRARAECDAVAVSIFVNPTQFGPNEDLSRYPRDLERDLELLRGEGVAFVFAPEAAEIYPAGFSSRIEVGEIGDRLEGAVRPGHFAAVATVVAKLFHIVQPHLAYFGQKDAQQALVIRRMVQDLNFPLHVVVGPTVRDADGLAMSSRNSYLSPGQRMAASVLFSALQAAKARYDAGEHDAESLRAAMAEVLGGEALAHPDYVSIADPEQLTEIERVGPAGALASLAVRIGATRLIDNVLLGPATLQAGG